MTEVGKKWAKEKATLPTLRYPATDPKGKHAHEEAEFWILAFCQDVQDQTVEAYGHDSPQLQGVVLDVLKRKLLGETK